MLEKALGETRNEELLYDILILFIGDLTPSSIMNVSHQKIVKFDPRQVYVFLQKINKGFAKQYLTYLSTELQFSIRQQDVNNVTYYDSCDLVTGFSD